MSDTPYADLSPATLLDAIDAIGLRADGSVTPLNSFENRVYQFGIDDGEPVVAKFYRPGRWSDAAIEEEHAFMDELDSAEVPCVAPFRHDGRTLFRHDGFRYAVFPREAGRAPNVEDPAVLRVLGHALGRLHAVGASRQYKHRARLSVETLGRQSVDFLVASGFVDLELLAAYEAVARQLVERIEPTMMDVPGIRIHGDCHLGNLLMRDDADAPLGQRPNFVDFDDTVTGPPIQDLWMLLAGDAVERSRQLRELVSAYEAFHDFDTRATRLIEPLRALRMLYHAAWIGRRWADPAFPVAFPAFGETRYWSEHILALKEQLAALDEPPLEI
ncbi:MAG: serine/threonine protein kinase [Gammaproteobacteria bacterium]|nr:serine/threonine protein kinase [Gammaproteobacteria bacterium]